MQGLHLAHRRVQFIGPGNQVVITESPHLGAAEAGADLVEHVFDYTNPSDKHMHI